MFRELNLRAPGKIQNRGSDGYAGMVADVSHKAAHPPFIVANLGQRSKRLSAVPHNLNSGSFSGKDTGGQGQGIGVAIAGGRIFHLLEESLNLP